ncbi:DAHL domain-containing protein [Massilia sp. TWR1-2-2]|uniref:DAHL domain-containing protein n=1 Tax=Massilia sp. TWR1-2-2 TaxID=2804584 RepID=UPI003CF253F0
MTPRRRNAVIVLLILLVLVLGFLFNRTTAVDLDAQNRVTLSLRELEKLDAEWNVNILRARIGLDNDYQALARPLPRIHQLTDSLRDSLGMTRGPTATQAYQQLSAALREKERLVEQFKSGNALLREALIYMPPAITDLKTELNGIEGALVPARTVLALDGALNALLTDILRFNLSPDVAQANRIETTLGTILIQKAAFSPAVGERIDQLIARARAVLRYRPLENAIEIAIGRTATTEAIERLSRSYDKAFDDVQTQKQRYRTWLFAYSGLLLLLLIWAARRLVRTYRLLGVVNKRLQASNETLEVRVAERTAELEAQSAKLEQLAHHDGLTGLVNYGYLTRLIEHALVRASRRGSTVVVMFFDLDGFKAVNDTFGHGTGDLVLKEVARRVQDKLRKEDSLARLGGDEFVILLEEVVSREGAMRVAQLTLDQICGITEAGGHPVNISASIGISSAHGRAGAERGAAALLAEADQAMYRTKQAGKAGFSFSAQAQWAAAPEPANTLQ